MTNLERQEIGTLEYQIDCLRTALVPDEEDAFDAYIARLSKDEQRAIVENAAEGRKLPKEIMRIVKANHVNLFRNAAREALGDN